MKDAKHFCQINHSAAKKVTKMSSVDSIRSYGWIRTRGLFRQGQQLIQALFSSFYEHSALETSCM